MLISDQSKIEQFRYFFNKSFLGNKKFIRYWVKRKTVNPRRMVREEMMAWIPLLDSGLDSGSTSNSFFWLQPSVEQMQAATLPL